MDIDQLRRFAPGAKPHVLDGILAGWHFAEAAGITTPKRVIQFMAQLFVESGGLRVTEENLRYSVKRLQVVWPSRFKSDRDAAPFANNPSALANRVYGGRMGNGPEESGDGWRYRGRGLKQLTGKANYRAFTAWARQRFPDAPDFAADPDRVAEFPWAFVSAVWFWDANGLSRLADNDDTLAITKRVNGGLNGLADRRAAVRKAAEVWDEAGEVSVIGRKTPSRTPIGWKAIAASAGGVSGAAAQSYEVVQLAQNARTFSDLLGIPLLVLVLLLIVAVLGAYIYWNRRQMAAVEKI